MTVYSFSFRDDVTFSGTKPDEINHQKVVAWVKNCAHQYSNREDPAHPNYNLIFCLEAIRHLVPSSYVTWCCNHAICYYVETTRREHYLKMIDSF